MAGFRRMVTASLLMLQVSISTAAISEQYIVRAAGDEATLPCGEETPGQDECDTTTWSFIGSGKTVPLVKYGKIQKEVKDKSDRLNVSEKCSLVIKNVTDEDVGTYTCRRDKTRQDEDAYVDLSVVTMTEHEDAGEVTVSCSVATYGQCGLTVKWLLEGSESDVVTSQPACSALLRIKKPHFESFKCEVIKQDMTGVYNFTFSRRPSSAAATTTTTTPPTRNEPNVTNKKTAENNLYGFRSIVVLVGLAALIVSVVAVNLWIRSKGKKTQVDETNVSFLLVFKVKSQFYFSFFLKCKQTKDVRISFCPT
ncbi:uncharacterized protein [Clinocottus analis]|uniref:uncharacterized protein n=1 Tax=Clinocottus analis TaxID=304258 RepID=UPI0035BFCAE0